MPEITAPKQVVAEGQTYQVPALSVDGGFTLQTSLDISSRENRIKILEIVDGESLPYENVVNTEFLLADFVAHPVQLTSKETGEVFDAIRLLLIDESGQVVSTCSPYVLESLKRIGWAQGKMPPWDPPIKVRLAQSKVADNKRVFKLQVVRR